MARQRPVDTPAAPNFIKHETPGGKEYYTREDDPGFGYIIEEGVYQRYPIEYIEWLLGEVVPTGEETQEAATGQYGREVTASAAEGRIAVLYGRNRIGGAVFFQGTYGAQNQHLVTALGLGHGPIYGVERFVVGGRNVIPGGTNEWGGALAYDLRLGTDPQAVSQILVDAATAMGFGGYPFTHPQFSHLVLDALYGQTEEPLTDALVSYIGRTVWDYRTGAAATLAELDNPALCLADYITNPNYGLGGLVDTASVIDAATYCSEQLGNGTITRLAVNYASGAGANLTGGIYVNLLTPTVTIAAPPPGGTQATATAIMGWREGYYRVTGLVITNPGSGYLTAPAVTVQADPLWPSNPASVTATLNERRHRFNMAIMRGASHRSIIDTIRAHFRCVVAQRAGKYALFVDKIRPRQMTFDVTNSAPGDVERIGGTSIPTAIRVAFVDALNDYQTRHASAYVSDAESGATEDRPADYSLEGITSQSEAARQAFYILNERNNNLRVTLLAVKAEALALEPFDRIGYISPSAALGEAGNPQDLTLLRISQNAVGEFALECKPYNEAILADTLRVEESTFVTALPDPNAIPAAPTVTLADLGNGVLEVGFTATASPFYRFTKVEIDRTDAGGTDTYPVGEAVSGPLFFTATGESATYKARARVVQTTGVESAPAESGNVVTAGVIGPQGDTGAPGANAKTMTVASDRQIITYDEAGALSPASQTTTFSTNKQNTTATVNWTATKADGTAITPVTNLLSAATGDTVTMTAAAFNTQRGTTEGVIVIATVTDGTAIIDRISVMKVQKGATGNTGAAGVNGVGFILTNEAHTVPAALDGSSPDLTNANGVVEVYSGATDVTATATISAATAVGCTGTVNTATGTPVAGQPKGYYRVTAMTADTAYLDIPVTYGAASVTLRFSLAKSKTGSTGNTGAPGANAKTMTVASDRQIITYNAAGALDPATQTTTFSTNKQNTTATVNWTATKADGTAITPVTNLLSAATGDTVTMTAANFNTQRGTTEGVIVIATVTDGAAITDRISVMRVQEGATGATGDTGPQGAAGAGVMTLLTNGGAVFSPTSFGKTAGALTWNASVYSAEGYQRGAFASWQMAQTNMAVMVALTSDPLAGVSYATLDYAFYMTTSDYRIYENGTPIQTFTAYTTDTVFSITYDGHHVRYFVDGVLKRIVDRPIGLPLFLSSSLVNVKATAQVVNAAFGPMGEQGPDASVVLAAPGGMAALGGRIVVGATTALAADLTAVATTISVNHAAFVNGDRVVLQKVLAGVQQTEVLGIASVASGTGPFTYTVTRDLDTSGANVWLEGDVVTSLGAVAGDAFIDIYTVQGLKAATEVGPSIVGNYRDSTTWNAWTPRWAVGNLNGLYGYAADTFGAAFGIPTGAWLKIDPTNGIRIGHNVTTKVQIDAAGNATFVGAITVGSGTIGGFTINATALYAGSGATRVQVQSNAGFWAGADAFASAPFSVSPAGALKATSGTIGGFTIGATELYAGAAATRVQMSTSGGFWAGATLAASAPFSVSVAGVLKAASGTIGSWAIDSTGISDGTIRLDAGAGVISITMAGYSPTYANAQTKFYADALGKFSLGAKLIYDGTNLEIYGGAYLTWGTIGGWTIAASSLAAGNMKIDANTSRIYFAATGYTNDAYFTVGSSSSIITASCSSLDVSAGYYGAGFVNAACYKVGGVQIIGEQLGQIDNAAATLADLQAKVNAILSRLRTHGLIDPYTGT